MYYHDLKASACLVLVIPSLLAAAVDVSPAWAEDLWLGIGGVWTERAVVSVTNRTDQDWSCRTVGIDAERLGLEGVRIAELRLVDEAGDAWQCGVLNGTNSVDRGGVPRGTTITFPVYLKAKASRRFILYWGNPKAWEVADVWRNVPDVGDDTVMSVSTEHLKAKRLGEGSSWLEEMRGEGVFRVPVTVANLSDEDRGEQLASFLLADALHGDSSAELVIAFDGRRVEGARFGTRYVFPVRLEPKTVRTYYLYARPRTVGAAKTVAGGGGIVSEILSDQTTLESAELSKPEEEFLLHLTASHLNKAKNGVLEDGSGAISGWDKFGRKENGVERKIDGAGGIVGRRCVTLSVSSAARPAWRSIGQRVDVKPSCEYFSGCFVRCEGLTNSAAHLFFNEFGQDGKAITAATKRSVNKISGTMPWTDLWRIFKTSAQTKELEMLLSSKSTGTTAVDCAIVAEHVSADLGEREYPCRSMTRGLAVAQRSTTEKVFPEKPIQDGRGPWTLALARNEMEELQLAIRSERNALVTAEVDVPLNANGGVLNVETFLVELVPVDTSVSYERSTRPEGALLWPKYGVPKGDGWRGLWPDPMVRTNGCSVCAETTRTFRFAVKAGPNTAAGLYRGAIRWKLDGKTVRTDPFEVKVWNFTIPARPEFAAGYDMRIPPDVFRAPKENDDEWARLRITDLMAEYKIAPTAFPAGEMFSRDADGCIVTDFTVHDAEAEKFFNIYRFPSAYMPRNPFYGFGVAARPKNFLGEEPYAKDETDRSKLRPEYVKAFQAALGMYWRHVKDKGWDKKLVLYISDEPRHWIKDIEVQMKALCKMIHDVDPAIPIYSSTWQYRPEWIGAIDVWGAGPYGCFTVGEMEKVRQSGGRLWFTTDGQMCIDTPYCAIEQMLPLYAAVHGVEKYEFWGAPWVTNDPWRFGWHAYVEGGIRFPNGDGFVIYPPRNAQMDARPCPSIRLAAARDGVELHSYCKLLEAPGKSGGKVADKAKALLDECHRLCIIPNAGGRRSTMLLTRPDVIDDWRFRVGTFLEEYGRQ